MTDFDPLAQVDTRRPNESAVPPEIPRDLWRRPMLIPAGGTVRVPYLRASSLADYIVNKRGLARWEIRHVARGIGMSRDLADRAAAETYNTGFGRRDDEGNKASGRRLDAIAEEAKIVSRANERAEYGTAVHKATETPNSPLGTAQQQDVDAWWHAMRGFKILDTEVFVACDELGAAGTLDHVVVDLETGELVVVDKKTGALHLDGFQVQLAVYAYGEAYGVDDARTSLEALYGPISRDYAYVAHLPAQTGRAQLIKIDLHAGYRAAKLAMEVAAYQRTTALAVPLTDEDLARKARAAVRNKLKGLISWHSLNMLYAQYADVWTPELTDLANEALREGGI